ncbi:MAG: hypothetical protein AB7E70_20215 [Hyphomicrobiaceae bacterium]
MTDFWTKRRTLAAQLVAEDELTDEKIAEQVGRSRKWLAEQKHLPEFRDRVKSIVEEFEKATLEHGIANKAKRLQALNDRWERGRRVINERAASDEWAHVPGWSTGLLVHDVKSVGGGEAAMQVDVFKVDTGLLGALGDMEMQAARELGQLPTRTEVTGADGGPVTFYLGVGDLGV